MHSNQQPLTKFVILNAPRTGSNMLCTVLNSHPQILCHHEIFNPHVVGYARHLQDGSFSIGTIAEREHDPIEFLGRVWKAPLGHRCVGFKLCWRQNEAIFRVVLEDVGLKKIVLKRRNRIKGYLSLLLARKTGAWVIYRGSELLKGRATVEVNVEDLHRTLAFNDEYYREIEDTLRETNQDYLTLDYEDLFSLSERARMLTYLGVSTTQVALLKEETLKLNPSDVRELVSNFAELAAALRGTELEAELYEDGVRRQS
jgi:hypothetical protein